MVPMLIHIFDTTKVHIVSHEDDGCKWNHYDPIYPETRFYIWVTGWTVEIKYRHGKETLLI